MKTKTLFLSLLLLCLGSTAMAQAPEKPQPSPSPAAQKTDAETSDYRQLVERAKRGDADVDFVKMRDAFVMWQCDEDGKTDPPNRDEMVAAFKANEYAKAVELAEIVLDYEFINVGLHRAAEDAYRKLDDQTKADFHKTIADKLTAALLASGDGKTAETAYRVLSIREEYFIMNQLGYAVRSQALLLIKERPYDMLSGQDKKTSKDVSVYFDISSFFGAGPCEEKKK